MNKVTLGRTGITVNKNGFGALPVQRVDMAEAERILKKAFDNGIDFYDTARFYSDSEEKIGYALSGVRDKIIIASKTMSKTPELFEKELDTSLSNLKTDHIDIYQFHNPNYCPKPDDGTGMYEAMLKAKKAGKILHIGITNHMLKIGNEAVESGLYETLQFPFNYLATDDDTALMKKTVSSGMGFISMKALSGGLITNSKAAYVFQNLYEGVLPIWGIQKESELDEFLSYGRNEPEMTEEIRNIIEKDRKELSGNFCRGCGYCMPTCPAGIKINDCARMSLLIRRSPSEKQLTPQVQAQMKKIEECTHCGVCKTKCPYHLDTPKLLEDNYKDYVEILNGKKI